MYFRTIFTTIAFFCLPFQSKSQIADTIGVANIMEEGDRLAASNRFEAAIVQFERAKALYTLVSDSEMMVDCLKSIAVCYGRLFIFEKSEAAFSQAIAIIEEKFRDRSDYWVANTYLQYGRMLHDKEDMKKARQFYEKSLKIAEAGCSADDGIFGRIYNDLALVHKIQGNYTESEALYFKALEAYKKAGEGMEEISYVHFNLSSQYSYCLDFDKAFYHLHLVEKWVDSIKVPPPSFQIVALYNNLYNVHNRSGNKPKALEYSLKFLEHVEKKYGPTHRFTATAYNNIAAYYVEQNRPAEAIRYYNLALQAADVIWKQPCKLRVVAYSNIAVCAYRNGKENEADIYWGKAIAEAKGLQEAHVGREQLAEINKTRAGLCIEHQKYADAVPYYQESITILGYPEIQNAPTLPSTLADLGRALVKTGRSEEAIVYLNQAIRLQTKSNIKPDNKGNLPDIAFQSTGKTQLTLLAKAEALLAQWGKNPQPETLEAAETNVEQAIRLGDYFRQRFQKSRSENFEWFQQNRSVYCAGVEIARQQYLSEKDPGKLERAFQLADRSKAILLSETVQDAAAKQYAGLPAEVLQTEKQLRRDIAFYETSTNGGTRRDSILFTLKRRQEALIQELEQRYPRYYEHRYATPSVSVGDIREAIGPNALFIEYMLDPNNNQIYIFTIDRSSGLKVSVAPLDAAANEQVRELNQLASSIFLVRKDKKARFIQLSHALYQQFLKPIESLLNEKNELIVIPDGCLGYLPFELLLKTPTDAPFENLRYLIHSFDVKYHYSGALLLNNTTNIPLIATDQDDRTDVSNKSFLAFAPVFVDNTNDNASENLSLRNRNVIDTTLRATFVDGEFSPLPYSEQEARTIAQLFGDSKAQILLYQAADEAALKAELQKKRRIAHIATHSFANLEQPQLSGIACAQPEDSSTTEDGILYVSEIYSLNIPVDLVVLSSCESGLGKLAGSEGLLGLNRAFAYAGVPNIIYSLWKVNDKASSELMIEFYKQMLSGKSYSAALRAAKLKMLKNPISASPNFWGGFLLTGQ